MTRLAIAFVLVSATADIAHAAPETHQVKLNGHTFTLPKGFTIELAAKTPLVDRPIVASFDDRGRLYVADTGNGRVQRLSPDGSPEASWWLPEP